MNKVVCIILLTLICLSSGEQEKFEKHIFRSPIDFPISLSGSFGDYRTNHFHSGIDIRTQGVTGKKVYAIADGWVSRIRISPYGYGLAVYLDHPQGYTSLYGHLNSFNNEIWEYILQKQYELQLNEIDIYLQQNEISVKQGDVIAHSGNSGSSSGPHIHFEIRESENQHPLNPLYFGFEIADNLPPEVYYVRIYPLESWSRVNGKLNAQNFLVTNKGNTYSIKENIQVSGKIGLGVYSLDKFSNGKYKHCFNALSMMVNEKETFRFRYEELDFETLRDVNSHMDYEMKLEKKQKVTKCYKEPHCRLDIYEVSVNDGIIELEQGESADIGIELTDNFNNRSKIELTLIGAQGEIRQGSKISFVKKLDATRENVYRDEKLALYFPEERLYRDEYLDIKKNSRTDFITDGIQVLPYHTALKDWYTIRIFCEASTYQDPDKLAVGKLKNDKVEKLYPSEFKNGWLHAQVKEFGEFVVVEDLLAPVILLNNYNEKSGKISLTVKDNFEQLNDYSAQINDQWVRLYYDRKNDLIKADLSELNLKSGEYQLDVNATDGQDNRGEFSMKIHI